LLEDVTFTVAPGEMLAVLGPSGAGKSTLLRAVAGLDAPDAGEIDLDGARVSAPGLVLVPPRARGVALVPQNLALWPHLTVREHLAFPPRMAGRSAADIADGVRAAAEAAGLASLLDRKPGQLSGGEQQRVALGRAFASHPRVLLLDEPVSSLDPHLRDSLRAEIRALQKRLGAAAVYVTHDRLEAFELADRVLLLAGGRLVQLSSPEEIYARPATPFAARFLGAVNELRGRRSGGRISLGGGYELDSPGPDGEVLVLLRPEDLEPGAESSPGFPAVVESSAFHGEHVLLVVRCGAMTLKVAARNGEHGSRLTLSVKPGRAKVYPL